MERFLSDNGNEFKGLFNQTTGNLKAEHTRIHAGRPQTNNSDRVHHGRLTTGQISADIVYGDQKMEVR